MKPWDGLPLFLLGLLVFLPLSSAAQNANPTGPVTLESPALTAPEPTAEEGLPANPIDAAEELGISNPIQLLSRSGDAINALTTGASGLAGQSQPSADSTAQANPGETPAANQGLSTSLSILLLLTVLTLVPAILVMCTSFTRIVVVLALLRQALGTQSLPPTQVIVGLSLFLTFLVMAPTLDRINTEVLQPMQDPEIEMNEIQAWEKAKAPLRDFMFAQIDHAGNWDSVYMLMEWRDPGSTKNKSELRRSDVDMLTLIPAFMLSELKVAFLLGFRLYLPFLVIDMVISSVLISMGMLMLPPVLISLPFKLLLFVLVDGWNLVVANLLSSFSMAGAG
ncbi:MAG: flagellar type III secretion system pore protein FliP [Planctomycetota bacterium]